jgi:hypothetical protein
MTRFGVKVAENLGSPIAVIVSSVTKHNCNKHHRKISITRNLK